MTEVSVEKVSMITKLRLGVLAVAAAALTSVAQGASSLSLHVGDPAPAFGPATWL